MNDMIGSTIHILCYHITKSAKYPFIQIMMEKQHYIPLTSVERFVLPFVSVSADTQTNLSKLVLDRVTRGLQELGCDPSVLNESDAFIGLLDLNNVKDNHNVKYALVDISPVDIYRIGLSRLNSTWFALPTEIMNMQTICNIPIDESITNLFLTMPELGMLHNPSTNNSMYPLPDGVYTGSYLKQVELMKMVIYSLPLNFTTVILFGS